MANGVNWTSLLYGTVDRYLDTLDRQETRKDYLAEKEADRIYSANIRQEDLTREDAQREEAQRQRLQVWNRNENRYQDEKRSKENELKLQKDTFLIQEGREAGNLVDQRSYYSNLIDSGKLNTPFAYDTAESRYRNLGSQISNARDNIKILQDIGLEERSLKHVENLYLQGKDVDAYNEITRALNAKFTNPQTVAKAQLYLMNMKRSSDDLKKVPPGEPYDADRKRLNDIYYNSTQSYLKLYDIEGIWDESAKVRHSQGMISSIQKELDEFGITFDQSKYASEFNEFAKTYYGEDVKPEDRNTSTKQIISSIVEQEKKAKTAGPPTVTTKVVENINELGPTGLALIGVGAYQAATSETAKKGYAYLNDKAVQAAKNIHKAVTMPADDIVKFVKSAQSSQVGSIGGSIPKIERFIEKVEKHADEVKSYADKPRSKAYKDAVKVHKGAVKALETQLNTVADGLYNRGIVSKSLKREDLIKLLKNPDKYRFTKLVAKLKGKIPGLAKWGIFSAGIKLGEWAGDPTGGLLTGYGVTKVPKITQKVTSTIYDIYKKNPTKFRKKLYKKFKKSAANRVVQWLANPAAKTPQTAAAFGLAGAGMLIYDVYDLFASPAEFEEEE